MLAAVHYIMHVFSDNWYLVAQNEKGLYQISKFL